jgi:hypothetical protein
MISYVSLLEKNIDYLELKRKPKKIKKKGMINQVTMIKTTKKIIKIQVKMLPNQENYLIMSPKEEMITSNKMLQLQEISSMRVGLDCH